jgi:uncharacterized damage-inducible protein DinB
MPARKPAEPFDVADALLAAFATNQRINQYLIDNLPDEAWRATPPDGKGRDVASIVGHIHNVRRMWLKAAAKDVEPPAKLEGAFTKKDAGEALDASYRSLRMLVSDAVMTDGRIKGFKPDVAGFVGYLLAHDAHHRGQVAMLARQVGHPLPQKAMFGMWEWGTR